MLEGDAAIGRVRARRMFGLLSGRWSLRPASRDSQKFYWKDRDSNLEPLELL